MPSTKPRIFKQPAFGVPPEFETFGKFHARKGRKSPYEDILLKVRTVPGQWAKIAEWDEGTWGTKQQASKRGKLAVKMWLRNHDPYGSWQVQRSNVNDGESRELWVMYERDLTEEELQAKKLANEKFKQEHFGDRARLAREAKKLAAAEKLLADAHKQYQEGLS